MQQKDGHTRFNKWRVITSVLAVIGLLAMTGCSKSNPSESVKPDIQVTDDGGSEQGIQEDQQALLSEFKLVAKEAADASALVTYMVENMAKADQSTADTMLRGLHDYYETHLEAAQNDFFASNVQEVLTAEAWPISKESAAAIKDEKVVALVQRAYAGGYKLETVEGTIYPIVDYSNQLQYSKSLSEQMNAYVQLMAEESNTAAAKDGGLVITWDELASRALLAEKFIADYADSPEREEVQTKYVNGYLAMYINGLPNTLIYDLETFKLLDEVKSSYQATIAKAPESATARMTKEFLEILTESDGQIIQQNDGELTELTAIKQFREGLANKAEKLLK